MKHYERRLPHFEVIDQPLFVTFRLDGSLPGHRVFPPAQVTDGKSFLAMDRILDAAATGPRFLAIPEIAARGFGFMGPGAPVREMRDALVRGHAESCPRASDAARGSDKMAGASEGVHRSASEPAAGPDRQQVLAGGKLRPAGEAG